MFLSLLSFSPSHVLSEMTLFRTILRWIVMIELIQNAWSFSILYHPTTTMIPAYDDDDSCSSSSVVSSFPKTKRRRRRGSRQDDTTTSSSTSKKPNSEGSSSHIPYALPLSLLLLRPQRRHWSWSSEKRSSSLSSLMSGYHSDSDDSDVDDNDINDDDVLDTDVPMDSSSFQHFSSPSTRWNTNSMNNNNNNNNVGDDDKVLFDNLQDNNRVVEYVNDDDEAIFGRGDFQHVLF